MDVLVSGLGSEPDKESRFRLLAVSLRTFSALSLCISTERTGSRQNTLAHLRLRSIL